MDIGFIIKIFGVGVVGSLASIILTRVGKQDVALLLELATVAVVFGSVVWKVKEIIEKVISTFGV